MGLRDIGATLPPGFRFYPSDEELVCHYLYKKITNEEVLKGTLMEIDLHTCEPWQLPGKLFWLTSHICLQNLCFLFLKIFVSHCYISSEFKASSHFFPFSFLLLFITDVTIINVTDKVWAPWFVFFCWHAFTMGQDIKITQNYFLYEADQHVWNGS